MAIISIDGSRIVDQNTLHDSISKAFGFPASYGRNLDAMIDCLTSLDDVNSAMTQVHVMPGHIATLKIDHGESFSKKYRDLFVKLVDVIAFVNWRRMEKGKLPVLTLAYFDE